MNIQINLEIDKNILQKYLNEKGWISTNDTIKSIEKPGEGNMNVVLRVKTSQKQIIIKQARPFVNKYPQIPAPIERIHVESRFYELVSQIEQIHHFMPNLIGFDAENHILAVEDLGAGADYTFIYQKENSLTDSEILQATEYLSILHNFDFDEGIIEQFPDNLSLRKLNHEHLFVYPFMPDNGFDLDTIQIGLQAYAMKFKTDENLKSEMNELGEIYLSKNHVPSKGFALLHGDYYSGSWLKVGDKFKVIDPEFCFFGPPEYDLGVMIAHLKMAQTPQNQIDIVLQNYVRPIGFSENLM
jgi:5-methylthioribose kinase